MSRKKELKEKQYQKIRARYSELESKNKNGVKLYRHAAILAFLSEEFYLTEDWISKILQKTQDAEINEG